MQGLNGEQHGMGEHSMVSSMGWGSTAVRPGWPGRPGGGKRREAARGTAGLTACGRGSCGCFRAVGGKAGWATDACSTGPTRQQPEQEGGKGVEALARLGSTQQHKRQGVEKVTLSVASLYHAYPVGQPLVKCTAASS